MKLLSAFAAAAILFSSCNNDSSEAYDKSLKFESTPVVVSEPAVVNDTANKIQEVIPANEVVATPQKPSAEVKLNPPHGQPNHRCDIAVGEPLSTPVRQIQAPAVTPSATAPVITSPAAGTSTGTSVAKLNPPHGEPGHDCSIAVGAPLKQ